MKYLVIESYLSYAVVLDETGRFFHVANRGYKVGETVTDVIIMRDVAASSLPGRSRRFFAQPRRFMMLLATLLAVLVVGIGAWVHLFRKPYASIYITINPQICLSLNRMGGVLDVYSLNKEGAALLAGYDPHGRDRFTVADDLLDRAILMGYLKEGDTVTIHAEAPDEVKARTYDAEFKDNLYNYLHERLSVTITIDPNTLAPEATQAPESVPTPTAVPTPEADPDDDDDHDDDDDDD